MYDSKYSNMWLWIMILGFVSALLLVFFIGRWLISKKNPARYARNKHCAACNRHPGKCEHVEHQKLRYTPELYPLMKTDFNLREMAKQMVLLEDHINCPRKRCMDCIRKHTLMLVALGDEATGLDGTTEAKNDARNAAQAVEPLVSDYLTGKIGPEDASQKLRVIRKKLMNKYYIPHVTESSDAVQNTQVTYISDLKE